MTDLIDNEKVMSFWQDRSSESGSLMKMVLSVEQTEKVLDLLEQKYGGMSSGMISPQFWREQAIPLLQERFEELKP